MSPERATYLLAEFDQIKAWLDDPTAELSHEDRLELRTVLQELQIDLEHLSKEGEQ